MDILIKIIIGGIIVSAIIGGIYAIVNEVKRTIRRKLNTVLNVGTLLSSVGEMEAATPKSVGGATDMFAKQIKRDFPNLKIGWYSGRQHLPDNFPIQHFDYIKVGPYIPKLGGLDSETTNQIMYKVEDGELIDITYRFKHDSKSSV